MTDTPTVPSLLASAHSLNSLLVSLTSPPAFSASPSSSTVAPPPSTLLHPLGPSPSLSPASLPLLKSHLSSTLSHLRASLSHFSTLALPPTPTATETAPTETKDDKARRDKYLTLLRDSAGHEATLLALRERDLTFAERLLLERRAAGGGTAGARSFAVLRPEEKAAKNGRGTLKLLERLGSDLGLAGFRDDEGVEPPPERVTLSLGGKVMVVDIEVVRTGREDEGERVDKVKVAYVAEGNDLVFAQGGDALLALLALPSPAAEEEESAAEEKEQRWQSIRRVLEQLHTLDAATDRTGWDQFAALSELSTNLSASFPPASSATSPADLSLPLLLPSTPCSLLPRLLLSANPSARLSSTFATLLSPTSSTLPSTPEGVYTATVTLSALQEPLKGAVEAEEGRAYVAVIEPRGVVITAEVGRRVCEALGLEGSSASSSEEGGKSPSTASRTSSEGGLDALLLDVSSSPSEDEERHWLSPSPSHPLSFRLASTPSSSPSRAYLATHLRFASVAQLQSAVGTLEAATRVGELVRSLKRLREGEGVGEGAGTKRRKKGMAGEMTLDELFADAPAATPLPLPVYLHLSPASPSLTLSFPHPISRAPMSITLAYPSASTGWRALITPPTSSNDDDSTTLEWLGAGAAAGEGEGGERGRSETLERVVEACEDLGMIMGWVVGKLRG